MAHALPGGLVAALRAGKAISAAVTDAGQLAGPACGPAWTTQKRCSAAACSSSSRWKGGRVGVTTDNNARSPAGVRSGVDDHEEQVGLARHLPADRGQTVALAGAS